MFFYFCENSKEKPLIQTIFFCSRILKWKKLFKLSFFIWKIELTKIRQHNMKKGKRKKNWPTMTMFQEICQLSVHSLKFFFSFQCLVCLSNESSHKNSTWHEKEGMYRAKRSLLNDILPQHWYETIFKLNTTSKDDYLSSKFISQAFLLCSLFLLMLIIYLTLNEPKTVCPKSFTFHNLIYWSGFTIFVILLRFFF